MRNVLLLVSLLTMNTALGQDSLNVLPAIVDTSWKHSAIVSANVTQISFTDWAQGGDNALAYALFLDGKSVYEVDVIQWANSYKFGYGQARLGSQSTRKTDDRIDLESVLTYKIGTYINPFASVSLKTQFAEGVIYDAAGSAVPVSNFFDPAYITQTIGVGYKPSSELKTRIGVALRETIADAYAAKYSDDLETIPDVEKTRVEGGIESVTEVNWPVMENIVFNAKLEIFAPVKNLDRMTVRSDNTLSAKINKYFSVNLNVYLINDTQIQARTQIKETLALGFSYTLL